MRKQIFAVLAVAVVLLGFFVAVMRTSSHEEELVREFFAEVRGKPSRFADLAKRPPDWGPEVRKISVGPEYYREEVLPKLWEESSEVYKLWGNPECLLITAADYDYKEGILYVWFEGRKKHFRDCERGLGEELEPLSVYGENFDSLYDFLWESQSEEIRRQVLVQSFWYDLKKMPRDSGLVLYRLIRFPKEATPKKVASVFML